MMDLDEALSRPGFLRDHFPAVAAACEQFVACQWESMLVTCQCADTAGSVARAAVRYLCAPASAGGGGLSPLHPEGGELRAGASGLLGALSEACAMPPALGGERRVGLFIAADRVERHVAVALKFACDRRGLGWVATASGASGVYGPLRTRMIWAPGGPRDARATLVFMGASEAAAAAAVDAEGMLGFGACVSHCRGVAGGARALLLGAMRLPCCPESVPKVRTASTRALAQAAGDRRRLSHAFLAAAAEAGCDRGAAAELAAELDALMAGGNRISFHAVHVERAVLRAMLFLQGVAVA